MAIGGRILDECPRYPRIVFLDLLGKRILWRQGFEECCGRNSADGELGGPLEKLPSFDQPVGVAIVKIQQFLIEVACILTFHLRLPFPSH